MEPDAKYLIVGAAVIALTMALVWATLWISEVGVARNTTSYTIYFEEQSLDGLQIDSNVTMKGIKIGSVREVRIAPQNIEQVRVRVELFEDSPVKVDTRAVINRNVLTGLANIELSGSSQDSETLTAVADGESSPVIAEGRSEFSKIADSVPELVERIGNLSMRFDSFLSDENQASFTKTLKHVESITAMLSDNSGDIDKSLKSISEITASLSELLDSLAAFLDNTRGQVATASSDIVKTSKQIRDTAQTLDTQIETVGGSLSSSAQVMSQEMVVLSESLSQAARSLSTTLERFEDPRAIITGPQADTLGPGESLGR